ncbi:MAG: hypothetical protein HGA55_03570 [Methanoregulaceae archaeon]|nr:hypothetical protein [Methanoregulaceae archaeon]
MVKSGRQLLSGSIYQVRRNGRIHIVAEDYSYKTECYYTLLSRELSGEPVDPDSRTVLDAAVVPLCLDKASRAGIPVADCIISQSCTDHLPAVLYGLNYFSSPSEFSIVRTSGDEREVIRHITNNGKYPFCYQPLGEGDEMLTATAIFGKSIDQAPEVEAAAAKLYGEFRIPLMTMVFIRTSRGYRLSSLAPARYSSLSAAEREILSAYITGQEFL